MHAHKHLAGTSSTGHTPLHTHRCGHYNTPHGDIAEPKLTQRGNQCAGLTMKVIDECHQLKAELNSPESQKFLRLWTDALTVER